MPTAGFELAMPASERPQTFTLDRAATGIGREINITIKFYVSTVHPDSSIQKQDGELK
jgi:hypothetical protein